ncbi:electron transfer flavoprotein subunit beta/FixA family protein [Thiolinea disciformis]|uniref:electron transfer flavoprotein subunit beta/FixA family protein n=1 Tax=Thiolinea disciformis TaxID=125614 RepID=UPI00037EAAF9|nr:electron transfer flavoprotein subunit beta/FixA family protein [Thiolinea disciformis]
MKILVAIKRVLDYSVKVRVKTDHSDVDLANAKMSMNPFCEIAVEEAVRLKEAGVASEIIVVSIGSKAVQETIRSAMAMGADRGIWIDSGEAALSPLTIAQLLAKVVQAEQPSVVLLGKQAIDSDDNQTGQMLAALCDYPQATFASKVTIADSKATVVREVDGGLQTLQLALPLVVTTDLRLNEPRYVKLPDIMKAKKKPLDTQTPESLGVSLNNSVKMIKVEPPSERKAGIMVPDVDALINSLKNQAKVL